MEPLHDADELNWLVESRNKIQSLMLQLLERWSELERYKRISALTVALSLWRAVFLFVRNEHNDEAEKVDRSARRFLEKLVRTNTIAFNDDLQLRTWSGNYYVKVAPNPNWYGLKNACPCIVRVFKCRGLSE
jgi:hypothetical protein